MTIQAWIDNITLTRHNVSLVKQAAIDFDHTSLYGRVIGHSPSQADIRDLLESILYLEDSHIGRQCIRKNYVTRGQPLYVHNHQYNTASYLLQIASGSGQ